MSLWAVLGLWLARRLFRLLVLIARSPAALITIGLTAGAVTSWQLVSPALPLGILAAWPSAHGTSSASSPGASHHRSVDQPRSWTEGQPREHGRVAVILRDHRRDGD